LITTIEWRPLSSNLIGFSRRTNEIPSTIVLRDRAVVASQRFDNTNLITVAARTPQKSALKLFRILYPTIGSRANCISISNIPDEKLTNIYLYVHILHQNLSFKMNDMRRAIGTSIRSATHEMRKLEHQRREQLKELENDENLDQAEREERINHAIDNMEMALNASDTATCNEEDDENEDIDKMSMDEEIYGDDDDDDEL
ncbi:unnamed protein product, partial [Rotaria magnacalcarata]